MPKDVWAHRWRKRRSKKRGGSKASQVPPSNPAVDSMAEEGRSAVNQVEVQIPSSALLPARRVQVRHSPPPPPPPPRPPVFLVKNEPTGIDAGETSLNNQLNNRDLPSIFLSENVTSAAHISEKEFENNENNSSSETVTAINMKKEPLYPDSKSTLMSSDVGKSYKCKVENSNENSSSETVSALNMKKEPLYPGYESTLMSTDAGKSSDVIDNDEHVTKKMKIELDESNIRIASVSSVKVTEECNEVLADQDDCRSVTSTITLLSSNDSADTLFMPFENINAEQDIIKVNQASNSAADVSAKESAVKSVKNELVSFEKEKDKNTPSLNSGELTKGGKAAVNISDIIDSKVLSEILANINIYNSGSVSAENVQQYPVPLKSTSIFTNNLGTESINNCSKTCLEKSKTISSVEWNTSPVALSLNLNSNSLRRSSNITVRSLKKRLCLDFDQSDALEAFNRSKGTISKPKKVLYPRKSRSTEISAQTDLICTEKQKQTLSMITKENVLSSSNWPPCITSDSTISLEIPCDAASAKQPVEIDNNPSDSTYDYSRNSIIDRPIKNLTIINTDTDLNRVHNFVPTPFIENESMNASYDARTESFGKHSTDMGFLNDLGYRNLNFEQNYNFTSHIENASGVPLAKSSMTRDLSLISGSPRNRTLNEVTEMTRTNNYEHDSNSTPHSAKSASLSFVQDSAVNLNSSRETANVTESTNVRSFIHVPSSNENDKKASSPPNVSCSDKNRAKLTDSGSVGKRKISPEEYFQRKKVFRVDNHDEKKLNSECPVVNSAKPSTVAEETLKIDSVHVHRDPRLRRKMACGTESDVVFPNIHASAASPSYSLRSGISNLIQSGVIASQVLQCLPSGSTASINSASATESETFQFPPCIASNVPPTSESGHCFEDFRRHQGNVVGAERFHSNIGKKIVPTSDVLHALLEWKCRWLDIQTKVQNFPPICDQYNEVKDNYDSVADYYNTYFPLYMLNIWLKIYNSWKNHLYPFYDANLQTCEEGNYVRISCTITKCSSLQDFLQCGDFVYVKFKVNRKEKAVFGYIVNVEEKENYTTLSNASWKKMMVSFYTAEKLNIPLESSVQIQKLENMRVLLMQHDALRSLGESPFKEAILNPKEKTSINYVVNLLPDARFTPQHIRLIVDHTNARYRITLVNAPQSTERVSFISRLLEDMIQTDSRVLVCLKDRNTLIELANKILNYIEVERFTIAVQLSEIELPDLLVRHTLLKRAKIEGKEPSGSETAPLYAQILKESRVILTVLSSIFINESKIAFSDSNLKCIIDEATLYTETETMLPLCYNVGHLVLIGDSQKGVQLHPNLHKYGYHKSLFSRLSK